MTLDVTVKHDGEQVYSQLGAQRGHRGEGRARAHARAHRRDRRPPAVDVGLRRGRDGHPDRARRRTRSRPAGPSCGPTSRRCCWCPSAPTRCSPGPLVVGPNSHLALEVVPRHAGGRRAVVRRAPGGRPPAGRADRGGRSEHAGAAGAAARRRRSPTGSSRSSTCRSTAGAAPPAGSRPPRLPRRPPSRRPPRGLSPCRGASVPCDSLARCCRRSGSRTSGSSTTPSWSCTPA